MHFYVCKDLTKLHVFVANNFVTNRHDITHFLKYPCIFRFPVSKLFPTHDCLQLVWVSHTSISKPIRLCIDVISLLI